MLTGSIFIALLFFGVGAAAGALAVLLVNHFSGKRDTPATGSQNILYPSEAILRRDRASGRLALEIGDQIITSPQALSPEQRQKAEKWALELPRWLGIQPAQAPPVVEAPPRPLTPAADVLPLVPAAIPPAVHPPASIVQQINEVLQEQLEGTPLAERAIRLSEGLRQNVVVWIGSSRYEGIDAVPDPQVKTAIRAAVSEWERRAARNSPSGQ